MSGPNSGIVKIHNKNQYIYQSTYSIKDRVHTTSSSMLMCLKKSIFSSCKTIKGLFKMTNIGKPKTGGKESVTYFGIRFFTCPDDG